MVGLGRFERPTSRLSGVRSDQLSYRPLELQAQALPRPSNTAARAPRAGGHQNGRDAWTATRAWSDGCDARCQDACAFLSSDLAHLTSAQQRCAALRKEVIQPQVPLRLPCYDFTPVADLTVDGCLLDPKIKVSTPASGQANSHGVTGGVYKARERIHRGMLIRDY